MSLQQGSADGNQTLQPLSLHLILGIAFAVLGLAAALLQTWLWTFPMAPDPSGRDPNGVTTAPIFWRYVHRGLGYLFAAIYVVMLVRMVPRFWTFVPEAWTVAALLHAALALLIAPILILKILILRRWQRLGKKLPMLGWSIAVSAFLLVGVASWPLLRLRNTSASLPESLTVMAHDHIQRNCLSCHGASRIVGEDGDREDWLDILEDMQENAADLRRPDPVASQTDLLATYLALTLGGEGKGEDDTGNSRGRGRGRGRGRD